MCSIIAAAAVVVVGVVVVVAASDRRPPTHPPPTIPHPAFLPPAVRGRERACVSVGGYPKSTRDGSDSRPASAAAACFRTAPWEDNTTATDDDREKEAQRERSCAMADGSFGGNTGRGRC
jgi:hypothetical protein